MSWAFMPCALCATTHERGSDDKPPCYAVPVTVQFVAGREREIDFGHLLDAETLTEVESRILSGEHP